MIHNGHFLLPHEPRRLNRQYPVLTDQLINEVLDRLPDDVPLEFLGIDSLMYQHVWTGDIANSESYPIHMILRRKVLTLLNYKKLSDYEGGYIVYKRGPYGLVSYLVDGLGQKFAGRILLALLYEAQRDAERAADILRICDELEDYLIEAS